MTSTELAHRAPMQAPARMTLEQKIRYAQVLADANLLPSQYRNNPGNVLFALEYAEALGIQPINAITSIHVIEGKPSASADLIASLIRKAGHRLRVSGDSTKARAELVRADDQDFTFVAEWDEAKARAAGLWGKGNWSKFPASMLKARVITEVGRAGASDALYGVIYTPEELGAQVDAEGNVVAAPSERLAPEQAGPAQQGTVEDRPVPPGVVVRTCDEWIAALAEATTVDEGRQMWREAGAAQRDADCGGMLLRDRITARIGELTAEEAQRTVDGETVDGAPAADTPDAGDDVDEAALEAALGPMPDGDQQQPATAAATRDDIVDAEIVPTPDPFETRKNSAPRRGHIAALIDLLGGNEETMAAACEQEFGLVPSDVSTARLREWQMKISKENS